MPCQKFKIHITPTGLTKVLTGMVILLLVANLISIYFRYIAGQPHSFFRIFYFNAEANIPTLYSFLTLVFCAILLWITSSLDQIKIKKQSIFCKTLSIIFLFVAIDEMTSIHETLTDNGRDLIDGFSADGLLHFAWVIPYGALFAFISIFLVKHFLRLPRQTKLMFTIAAVVFLSGAVGLEMVGGRYIYLNGDEAVHTHLKYALITTVEELLEMVGVIVFIHALMEFYLQHAQNNKLKFRLSLSHDPIGI